VLLDEVLPRVPYRQWVLSVPFQLRFLFASYSDLMGRALGIVYRCIATWLIHQAGFTHSRARTGAVTFIQRFGSALNLNVHFHSCFWTVSTSPVLTRRNRFSGIARLFFLYVNIRYLTILLVSPTFREKTI
jgi:hypothetical protein